MSAREDKSRDDAYAFGRNHFQEMSDIATANLDKAQRKQYYDKKARSQILKVGDKVQVLVPTKCSKLQLEWAAPYNITKQVTPVDFDVVTPGRCNTRRICHVNFLKKWHTPPNPISLLVILQEPPQREEDGGEEGDLESYLLSAGDQQLVTVNSLTTSQQQDLQQLLQEFPDVAGEKLGRTTCSSATQN